MSDVTIWCDPVRCKHYIKKGNAIEEIRPLTRQYIDDLTLENAKLRKENKRLRTAAVRHYNNLLRTDDVFGQIMARKRLQELGIEVD